MFEVGIIVIMVAFIAYNVWFTVQTKRKMATLCDYLLDAASDIKTKLTQIKETVDNVPEYSVSEELSEELMKKRIEEQTLFNEGLSNILNYTAKGDKE